MLEAPERLRTVSRGGHLEAVHPELVGEDDEQVRVVVDDQDPGRNRQAVRNTTHHRPRIAAPNRRPKRPEGTMPGWLATLVASPAPGLRAEQVTERNGLPELSDSVSGRGMVATRS